MDATPTEVRQALARLYVESMHYRDTGAGVQHLNDALVHAAHMLDSHNTCSAICRERRATTLV